MPPDNPTPPRVSSVDAYRGFVMLLMLAECLSLPAVAKNFPDDAGWQAVRFHTSHVDWAGCSLHDLIQPSFSFLVGVAAVFSLANRRRRGDPFWRSLLHAVLRAAFLVAWGIVLRSLGPDHTRTNFVFTDTLTQIGLGYVPLFLLAHLRPRWWWVAAAVLLIGTWLIYFLYPLPPEGFDYAAVGVKDTWPHHRDGLAAHWNKNSNAGWALDTWFLNLFPRPKPFLFNPGGYATLNFVPTLATMVLGLIAGGWLTDPGRWRAVLWCAVAGAVGLAAGRLCGELGICPVVKRLWTPSWVLFSGGWCFLLLAAFHALSDCTGYTGWTYPLRVIGANSILIYTLEGLRLNEWVPDQLAKHLPAGTFAAFGSVWEQVLKGGTWLLIAWLGLWWLYRRRVFVRI